jgi:Protein of unknown function (DUF2934)
MNLELLELSETERTAAREQIRRMAFLKWQDAGCPLSDPCHFWREAEREWIEYYYVPDRSNLV